MPNLGDVVHKIRSKNAGPFWITLDVFCGKPDVYQTVCAGISTEQVAEVFLVDVDSIKRFEVKNLNVVKFSIPRPIVQGDRFDRDMHGAQWAVLLAQLKVKDLP